MSAAATRRSPEAAPGTFLVSHPRHAGWTPTTSPTPSPSWSRRPASRHRRAARLRGCTTCGTSFTVATLLDWYRDGGDVQARLPLLSTWLGHVDPKSTYWYLQAVPELLALAAARLEQQPDGGPAVTDSPRSCKGSSPTS